MKGHNPREQEGKEENLLHHLTASLETPYVKLVGITQFFVELANF
jgi:hypothetical protein